MLEYWIAGGIVVLGIIIFFFLTSRKSYRQPTMKETSGIGGDKEIAHYEEMRDEATLADAESEEEEEEEEVEEEPDDYRNVTDTSASNSVSSALSGVFSFLPIMVVFVVGIVVLSNLGLFHGGTGLNNSAKTYSSADFRNVVVDGMGEAGQAITEWLDLIVLLIVLGFIIGVFVKLGGLFDTSSYEEPVKKKVRKPEAIKHYEGMRDTVTAMSAKRDKAKLRRLKREGQQ